MESGESESIRTLRGHNAGVYHCDVSTVTRLIISCSSGDSDNVLLWEWSRDNPCASLKGHSKAVHHATFSADGSFAATADKHGYVLVHDIDREVATNHLCMHYGAAHCTSFCRESPHLLCSTGHDGTIQLTDLRMNTDTFMRPSMVANIVSLRSSSGISSAHAGRAVYAAEFVDSNTIYTAGADRKMKRWDMRAGAQEAKCVWEYLGHTCTIRSLKVSPDRRFAITGGEDGASRLWECHCLDSLQVRQENLERQISQLHAHGRRSDECRALRAASANLKKKQSQLQKDGISPASFTLIGHKGFVSSFSWRDGDDKFASILSSSWDQTVRHFKIDLNELPP